MQLQNALWSHEKEAETINSPLFTFYVRKGIYFFFYSLTAHEHQQRREGDVFLTKLRRGRSVITK